MIVDKINAYLSGEGKTIDEAILTDVGNLSKWAFGRQFGERQERKNTVRLSSIGKCLRQQAYNLLGFEENGKEIDARARMVFLMGDLTECAVVGLIRTIGVKIDHVGDKQQEVEIMGISGHPDGIVEFAGEQFLLEVKSMSSFSFKSFEEGQLDEGYRYQINAYLHALNLKECIVIALNKDAGVLAEMLVRRDEAIVADIKERIETLKRVTKEDLPYRPYGPDEKGFLPWQCRFCGFYKLCWPSSELVLRGKAYKLYIPSSSNGNDEILQSVQGTKIDE